MFQAILRTQWIATRGMALFTTVLAFALPLGSLAVARDSFTPTDFVSTMQQWGAAYSILAAVLGLLLALGAWRQDQAGRHVYALSLPIPRTQYALFRFGAGAVFLVPALIALLAGCLLVAASGAIPDGLHAYPLALTLRFAFASAVSYAVFFAIAGSTPRTAGLVLGSLLGLLFAQYLLSVIIQSKTDVISPVFDFIFYKPGILSVFSGRWMLVDV